MLATFRVLDFQTGAKEGANALIAALTQYRPAPILLLFSGGSPLEMLQYLPKDLCDDRVTVGVSDERFSTDPTINNFAQIRDRIPFEHAIDTRPRPGETLEQLAVRFDHSLKEWRVAYPNGKILITQGIGLDGHTAGMMPYPENPSFFDSTFIQTPSWVVGYDAGKKNTYPLRITTTVPFLLQVDDAIVFACGPDKQIPVERVFAKKDDIAAVPGRIIHAMKHVSFFTDRTW